MAVLHLILYITVTGGGIRGDMKSISERLGRSEKAKLRNLWDWIGSKTNRHILLLHLWVQYR